jgi:hypothetical protein
MEGKRFRKSLVAFVHKVRAKPSVRVNIHKPARYDFSARINHFFVHFGQYVCANLGNFAVSHPDIRIYYLRG